MVREHKEYKLHIPADVKRLQEVLQFLDEHLEEHGCSMKAQMQMDIAVEEIFVNIANYAYNGDVGDADIKMSFSKDGSDRSFVSISFYDQGMYFDPLDHADPDITLSAAERQIGGLGILMVKKYMDDIFYEYKDGHNILTMMKYLD